MQRYRSSAHGAWPQTTSNVWQPCRAPTCCPGIEWFAGVCRRRARRHSCSLGNANRGHGSIKERRKRMLGRARAPENAALLPRHWPYWQAAQCYIEYARSCLKRIEAAAAAGTTVSPGARRARRGCCCCWSCHAVPGRQAQAEHAASLLTSTVCAATTSRLQCRWALLSSYVVVVECSKLNNAR